ncbi:5-formyltetrahydrofolate cyclo-ligase, putative [Pediculus humanus corporis]|uniref:5-formyltetrahydrofolate cyclo-ligase n=1 Tax=Pediculus humanus subsp. corporis TaxID=121224 RepID=E0VG47_PEDHC|nr:5-formyltetrahydrofolate cyclo-ligase, putative [Pediculus humanus corporis]EEB12353.1 5-formyltetrahydrofolate cyclo-ligase, putative [Pediculus humanus corporis]
MQDKQIMSAKSVLRKQLYSIINNLSKEEINRQSKIVTAKVLQNEEFKKSKVVSIYLSMHNEIQTEDILEEIFKQEKKCFIPR